MHYFCFILVDPPGQGVISAELAEQIVQSAMTHFRPLSAEPFSSVQHPMLEENCRRYKLTNREREIVPWICQGLSYLEIGEKLFISARTVAKHVEHIFEKLGVGNKVELVSKLMSPR